VLKSQVLKKEVDLSSNEATALSIEKLTGVKVSVTNMKGFNKETESKPPEDGPYGFKGHVTSEVEISEGPSLSDMIARATGVQVSVGDLISNKTSDEGTAT
jgi:hypothetical protein